MSKLPDQQSRITIPQVFAEHLNFELGKSVYVYFSSDNKLFISQNYLIQEEMINISKFEKTKFRFYLGKDVCEQFIPSSITSISYYVKNDLLYLSLITK